MGSDADELLLSYGQRLAELDIDARIDHRTLAAQGIDLEPQSKIGAAASRMAASTAGPLRSPPQAASAAMS